MKKIGFVDFYISEWHANNYPIWIKELNEKNGTDYEVAYVYAEQDISPVDQRSTAEWCREFSAEQCSTIEELCEKSDCIVILAPTNPEKHLPYAKTVLTYGKPTYIDKSFAPDLHEADEIMAIAKKYGTPFFSTSALRYAAELKEAPAVQNMIITGSGTTLCEYGIHHIEMAVMLLADPVVSVKVDCQGAQRFIHLVTSTGKKAMLMFSRKLPYSVIIEKADGGYWNADIKSDFFKGLLADIIRFYETGETSFDIAQLREVMRVRDMILTAEKEVERK